MLTSHKLMIVANTVRLLSTSTYNSASHYDVLGITPKATQADIKSAYYKLSMEYHPDRNKDEAAALKFRSITAAYEVLGNVRMKKLYDRGVVGGSRFTQQPQDFKHHREEPEDPKMKFYKSHPKRNVAPTVDGTTPIYDFDAWSKQHYGDTFNQKMAIKHRANMRMRREMYNTAHTNLENFFYIMILGSAVIFALSDLLRKDYDIVDPSTTIKVKSDEPKM